ncbi:Uncharacterized protein HZ326_20242 [Fusarium oxysporum f. sp. albedinis]|nr:Uncharacterized protein HZ326_20242 [Fusarium oxysporum f. sp. albedinis]
MRLTEPSACTDYRWEERGLLAMKARSSTQLPASSLHCTTINQQNKIAMPNHSRRSRESICGNIHLHAEEGLRAYNYHIELRFCSQLLSQLPF